MFLQNYENTARYIISGVWNPAGTPSVIYTEGNANTSNSICTLLTYAYSTSDTPHFFYSGSGINVFVPIGTSANTEFEFIATLITPTTEQTTPFTETEIVGSTEEFIDYEVAQDNRDVAIPVGTETDYYQSYNIPSMPFTDCYLSASNQKLGWVSN